MWIVMLLTEKVIGMRPITLPLLFTISTVFGLTACEPTTLVYKDDPACVDDSDCPDGICLRGECIDGECTKDADCKPLPPTCSSSNTMMLRPTGTCDEEYHCIYDQVEENCDHGCDFDTGQCKSEPCEGVICQTPPSDCFFADGTCVDGACEYNLRNGADCDDNDTCTTNDTCSEGVCLGEPIICNGPPANVCTILGGLQAYRALGTCVSGTCEYEWDGMMCDFGCTDGACNGNPCGSVTCDTPPADYCVDADHVLQHQPLGSCDSGACAYQDAVVFCPFGCYSGACRPDPCGNVSCDNPPPPVCVNSNTRRASSPTGDCVDGTCQYMAATYTCDYGCVDGLCRDNPCLGTNCDDGNDCTNDSCNPQSGQCSHLAVGGAIPCTTGSSDCPAGTCAGTTCVARSGDACVAEVDVDICHDVEVAGICTGSGECVVQDVPPEYYCPDCNGICIQCYILQFCVPFF